MFTHSRRVVTAVAGVAALVLAGLAAAGPAAATHPPGTDGSTITLDTGRSYFTYDVADDANGTAYIGWIADTAKLGRAVHLCTLPVNATKCSGGVQVIDSRGTSSAAGLRVLATSSGNVTLVWFHDTDKSISGPQGAMIAEATAAHGLHLSAARDVATAPSFGELLGAEYGPRGSIWTMAYSGVGSRTIQVREGLTAASTNVHEPWAVGEAQLAFSAGAPIITIQKYGTISDPTAFATTSRTGWTAFHGVAGTWSGGANAALIATSRGVRLVTDDNDVPYRAVLSHWTGTGFSKRAFTADDNNCGPSSHDPDADSSGRFVDVSWECNKVTVTSYPDDAHAAIVRFNTPGTPTYTPQIASSARGIATVAWSNETSGGGSTLHITRVRLPDTTRTVSGHNTGGRIVVTGPTNCVPASNVPARVVGHSARGWHVSARSLKLGSTAVLNSTVDGATLSASHDYTLNGVVTFAKGKARSVARASLTFRTCSAS